MSSVLAIRPPAPGEQDQRVWLRHVSWAQFEALLAMRGESSNPRIAYFEGTLEFMSPSVPHEHIKTTLARLLEAYAEENDLYFNGYGSWTLKRRGKKSGLEPDECYCIGSDKDKPDLALEVVWTSGGIDKLAIYRALEVKEVWFWQDGKIQVYVLKRGDYTRAARSHLLPGIDLKAMARLSTRGDQTAAVREYRKRLRKVKA